MIRKKRKTYPEIRQLILNEFSKGERTVNQIAAKTGLTWRTVDGHLIHLIGTGKIEPVFLSEYVKIYRLKEEGRRQKDVGRRWKEEGRRTNVPGARHE
ncbi:ArsR family transcriptional regulator [Candidatus Woesearchaeota archaeon]|nr:ArsR family transcriptional regulator [Candidatus Woesearchaeota archaeon]